MFLEEMKEKKTEREENFFWINNKKKLFPFRECVVKIEIYIAHLRRIWKKQIH
jgi:hypothetical protein